jgi:hypothetical protein
MRPVAVLLLSSALAACTLPVEPTVNASDLATRVSGTLTAQAPTAGPQVLPTDTLPPPPTESATAVLPTDTPTATVSPTASLTPTTVSGDPRPALGEPTWRDRFANAGNWTLGEDSFTEAELEDEGLSLKGKTSTDGWRVSVPEIGDFYLEATFRPETCSGNDHYGLMFRIPDRHAADEGYLLGLTCDGRFWLRLWDGENMDTLVPLTANSAIVSGSNKTNRLGVWADGEALKLYANGTLLDELTDDSLTDEGGFGLFVGARQTDDFTILVSEVAYWDLP